VAGEESRAIRAAQFPSSLDLLETDARARGWRVQRTAVSAVIWSTMSQRPPLQWPQARPVEKSSLPTLFNRALQLQSVPTTIYGANLDVVLPACIKPDIGSLGAGFRCITTAQEWQQFVDDGPHARNFVVQPLLRGPECRVTLCANGTHACADLLERVGPLSRWRDSTLEIVPGWLEDLYVVLTQLAVPVIGVDIMRHDNGAFVLDVNVAPDLAVHLATATPRNLATAVLDSWDRPS
jgi:hypothetical protein